MSKKKSGRIAGAEADGDWLVRLRLNARDAVTALPANARAEDVRRIADKWSYDLRNRRYWAGRENSRLERGALARKTLTAARPFGLSDDDLLRVAQSDVVEVEFSNAESDAAGAAFLIPWEYLISAATREFRTRGLLVSRRIATGGKRPAKAPATLLFIESAPGPLAGLFTFDSERELAVQSLQFKKTPEIAQNESPAQLSARIKTGADVIHFAGFDSAQASKLTDAAALADKKKTGIVVADGGGKLKVITGNEFAGAFKGLKSPPQLVFFNCYNSAARLAAMSLVGGAAAAIGFQDYVDDDLAEYFAGAFYREWRKSGWRTHRAFDRAWASLRQNRRNLHGTGIVLWTAYSQFDAERMEGRGPAKPVKLPVEQQIVCRVEPRPTINYSLLHNDQPLFLAFTINRVEGVEPIELSITVELNVGTETYPFRAVVRLGEDSLQLHDRIKVPLTSDFARSLRDRVVTTVYTRIEAGSKVILAQTDRVVMLPIDEWSDDSSAATRDPADRRSIWLPSFILPRDPAVRKIIDDAQKYLAALNDDPQAGFDGYQSIDGADPDTWWVVDNQAQAIWYTIVNDARLSYINPPPGGTSTTQRLRTPTDVIEGRRGTCIDLALLYAACLEYAEIYAAVILLTGHAFPAYWRSDFAHGDFVNKPIDDVDGVSAAPDAGATMKSAGNSGIVSWAFDNDPMRVKRMLKCVQHRHLAPIETVMLATNGGFEAALAKGRKNLSQPSEFEYLLDTTQARGNERPVMPLPLSKYGS